MEAEKRIARLKAQKLELKTQQADGNELMKNQEVEPAAIEFILKLGPLRLLGFSDDDTLEDVRHEKCGYDLTVIHPNGEHIRAIKIKS